MVIEAKEKICNVKMTLETQVMNLESAAQNADTFNAMKSGTNTMKKLGRMLVLIKWMI